jgi:CRP-like cAMP-binding protein
MSFFTQIIVVAILGLAVTSSNIIGAAIGLYFTPSKRVLSCVLAFAAGALITALAVELGYESANDLHDRGFTTEAAWLFVGGGFAVGAVFYYAVSLLLEGEGAAIRFPTRFREYASRRQQKDTAEIIKLLAQGELLRHLPPEDISELLPLITRRSLMPDEIVFRAGEEGDCLYIVVSGKVEVIEGGGPDCHSLAELGPGQAFGEMALLSGEPRTATIRAAGPTELLAIRREDFLRLMAEDSQLAASARRLSHERAIRNLSAGGDGRYRDVWVRVARDSLGPVSPRESERILAEAAKGAGLAIVFGNILDTIPGCLVIGAKFAGLSNLSLTLILGMFLGGIPEAAASGAMLRRAGFRPQTVFLLWSTVLIAGMVAAAAGKAFLGGTDSLAAVFFQAVAGGAVLALIAHAMIPEAIDEAGSLIVLPTVAGFLAALYPALAESFTATIP